MTNKFTLNKDDSMTLELRECASLLLEKLQSDDYQEASKMIANLNEARDSTIFQCVGELTRALHESTKNFNIRGAVPVSSTHLTLPTIYTQSRLVATRLSHNT